MGSSAVKTALVGPSGPTGSCQRSLDRSPPFASDRRAARWSDPPGSAAGPPGRWPSWPPRSADRRDRGVRIRVAAPTRRLHYSAATCPPLWTRMFSESRSAGSDHLGCRARRMDSPLRRFPSHWEPAPLINPRDSVTPRQRRHRGGTAVECRCVIKVLYRTPRYKRYLLWSNIEQKTVDCGYSTSLYCMRYLNL